MKLFSELKKPEGKILIKGHRMTIAARLDLIIRFEADGAYTNVVLKGGQQILWSQHLKEVEKKLDKNYFIRIHKSTIINLAEFVNHIDGRCGLIEVSDGTILQLAQRRRKEFLQRIHGADYPVKPRSFRNDTRSSNNPSSSLAS